jgi:hypothetical protein
MPGQKVYSVAFAESIVGSDALTIPSEEDGIPRRVYTNLGDCIAAIQRHLRAAGFRIVPVMYGEAFPFEGIRFEDHLEENGHAFYCKAEKRDDNGDVEFAIGVAVVQHIVA